MNTEPKKSAARKAEWERVRDDLGRAIGSAAGQVEHETERLVTYINNEVVPAVRGHSSRALRTAAEKLARFADYIDSLKKPPSGS